MDNSDVLEHQAIDAAIKSDWDTAIKLNEQIIKKDKNNIEALLRLAFAYFQNNEIQKSKTIYKKASKLQPNNYAITEYLDRIKVIETKRVKTKYNLELTLDPNLFLETPGKTKSVLLVNLGQKNSLAHLTIGQKVYVSVKSKKVEIRTQDKEYIGSLPDDVSRRLSVLIKAGSEFGAHVKEANLSKVIVFLREEKKGRRVMKYISFPANFEQPILPEDENHEESKDEESDESNENDLEKLAETLTSEEKEYLPYNPDDQEDEEEE